MFKLCKFLPNSDLFKLGFIVKIFVEYLTLSEYDWALFEVSLFTYRYTTKSWKALLKNLPTDASLIIVTERREILNLPRSLKLVKISTLEPVYL